MKILLLSNFNQRTFYWEATGHSVQSSVPQKQLQRPISEYKKYCHLTTKKNRHAEKAGVWMTVVNSKHKSNSFWRFSISIYESSIAMSHYVIYILFIQRAIILLTLPVTLACLPLSPADYFPFHYSTFYFFFIHFLCNSMST